MGTMTMIRKNGVWVPVIQLDWVTVPAANFLAGFSTDAANPLQHAMVEVAGGKYLFLRGTLVLPNPLPGANTNAVNGLPFTAYHQYHYEPFGPMAGWGGVGRRSYLLFGGNSGILTWVFVSGSPQVAGEVVDMAALGALRLG